MERQGKDFLSTESILFLGIDSDHTLPLYMLLLSHLLAEMKDKNGERRFIMTFSIFLLKNRLFERKMR